MFGDHPKPPPSPADDVDENGAPETPAKVAIDKRKKRNLTYAGLGLAAIGTVVTIYIAKRNSAAATTTTTLPDTSGGALALPGSQSTDTGTVAGSGSGDSSSQYATLQAQLASDEKAQAAASAGFTAAIARLTAELKATHGIDPGTASSLPKINAGNYAHTMPNTAEFSILGTTGPTGYFGKGVTGGAPVYAHEKVGGVWEWVQGVLPSKAPVGTEFGTPTQFTKYEVPNAKLQPVAHPPHG